MVRKIPLEGIAGLGLGRIIISSMDEEKPSARHNIFCDFAKGSLLFKIQLDEPITTQMNQIRQICRIIGQQSASIFASFHRRGKYQDLQISYDAECQVLEILYQPLQRIGIIDKNSFPFEEIAKGCDLLTLIRVSLHEITKMVLGFPKSGLFKICEINLFGFTLAFQASFCTNNQSPVKVKKTYFQKYSLLEFNRALPVHTIAEYSVYCVSKNIKGEPILQFDPIPTNQQFYRGLKINFLNLVVSFSKEQEALIEKEIASSELSQIFKQSYFRALEDNFPLFHQCLQLFEGKVPINYNANLKKFYRLCCGSAWFNGKGSQKCEIVFSNLHQPFNFQFMHQSEEILVGLKGSLCLGRKVGNSGTEERDYFEISTYCTGINISEERLHYLFLKKFFLRSQITFREDSTRIIIRNENDLCKILSKFSFFQDLVFLVEIEAIIWRKKHQIKNMIDQQQFKKNQWNKTPLVKEPPLRVLNFCQGRDIPQEVVLPPSQTFSLFISKYYVNYSLKLTVSPLQDGYIFLLHSVLVRRDKKTRKMEEQTIEIVGNKIEGLTTYINSILQISNARHCFENITDFAANFLNTFLSCSSDNVIFRTDMMWRTVQDRVQRTVSYLTRLLKTATMNCFLQATQGYEYRDFKDGPGQCDCLFQFTIKAVEIRPGGPIDLIPSYLFIFQFYFTQVRIKETQHNTWIKFNVHEMRKVLPRLIKLYVPEVHKRLQQAKK